MKRSHLYFLFLLCASMLCCTDRKAGDEPEPLGWGTASLCVEEPIAEGESLYYHIEFRLDTLAGDGKLASALSELLRDSVLRAGGCASISGAMSFLADSIRAEWQKELAELYDAESELKETLQYSLLTEGSPLGADGDSILSYRTVTDSFLGGAHGSHVVNYYNFSRCDGRLLKVSDVVPAYRERGVLRQMRRRLCREWNVRNLTELREKTGITLLGDLYLTENFLIQGDSLTFFYNQYDIAPYSAGLISITIPLPASR